MAVPVEEDALQPPRDRHRLAVLGAAPVVDRMFQDQQQMRLCPRRSRHGFMAAHRGCWLDRDFSHLHRLLLALDRLGRARDRA